MPFCDSLADFVRMVGESPDHAVGCRLKKACLKKAMQDIRLSLMKVLGPGPWALNFFF